MARAWKTRKFEFGTSADLHTLHLYFSCFIRHLWNGKASHKGWPTLQEDIPDSALLLTLIYVSGIGNSNPFWLLEVIKKTFVMMNDSSNSDVKIYAMKYRRAPTSYWWHVLFVLFIQGFYPLNAFFSLSWNRLRYQLPGVFTAMDNVDRITSLWRAIRIY